MTGSSASSSGWPWSRRPGYHPGYERSCDPGGCVFGREWTDKNATRFGHNGCDTRQDVLLEQMTRHRAPLGVDVPDLPGAAARPLHRRPADLARRRLRHPDRPRLPAGPGVARGRLGLAPHSAASRSPTTSTSSCSPSAPGPTRPRRTAHRRSGCRRAGRSGATTSWPTCGSRSPTTCRSPRPMRTGCARSSRPADRRPWLAQSAFALNLGGGALGLPAVGAVLGEAGHGGDHQGADDDQQREPDRDLRGPLDRARRR